MMKRKIGSFVSGVLAAAVVFSAAAAAVSSRMTIEVDPIRVQVNDKVFAPTDATGKEVPVFAYQGTTYAPLRALAEAYGLEVGYDAAANMATVNAKGQHGNTTDAGPVSDTVGKSEEAEPSDSPDLSYEEFKMLWVVKVFDAEGVFMSRNDPKLQSWLDTAPDELFETYCNRFAREHTGLLRAEFCSLGETVYTYHAE